MICGPILKTEDDFDVLEDQTNKKSKVHLLEGYLGYVSNRMYFIFRTDSPYICT